MEKHLLSCLLMMYGFSAHAQISIDFPKERQVFQRTGFDHSTNFRGDGIIRISGNFSSEYDSIQAKVEPRVMGQGIATSWTKINDRNSKPYFNGSINAKGGWYTLYVKAFKNGFEIDVDTVQRVGIGEVFAIAGQSNAQGGDNGAASPLAYDDRVVAINYDNDTTTFNKLAIGFSKIDSDSSSLGSFHYVPWNWARLGDLLADSLNVPILFYGAAHGGTKVIWWKEAAEGSPLTSPEFYIREEIGAPYQGLKVILNFYASLTGLRGIIWHQGESDHATPSSTYQSYLETLISESRIDSENPDLAWIICRVSYASGGTSANPVTGQNLVISNDANVFAGPITDNLTSATSHRETLYNTHFNTAGLFEFSRLLEQYIDTIFLENSIPLIASDFIELDFACNPGNPSTPITLTSSISYDKYAWTNRDNTDSEAKGYSHDGCCEYINYPPEGYQRLNWEYDSTSSITVGTGKYALNVRKATSGKVLFSPVVDLNTFKLPTNPTFTSSAMQVRSGDTLTLTGSTCNGTYLWNTMVTGSPYELYPTATSNYTVACKTLHCLSSASAPIEVVVSSCFADHLNLTSGVYGTESPYKSQQTITSTQLLSPSGKINYSANQTITLGPGFTARAGSVFKATIQNCP